MRRSDAPVESSAETMVALRARIEEALAARAAELYRYASDRLRKAGTPLDDVVSILQEAIPCYAVSVFRATNAPVLIGQGCASMVETLPRALADLATDCVLSRRSPHGLGELAESLHATYGVGLGFRAAELTVRIRPQREAPGDLPAAGLRVTLSPGPAPREAVEAAIRATDA